MVTGTEIIKAAAWAKQALDRLTRDDLPPTPENYAVFYTYFAETNLGLNAALDDNYKTAQAITQKICTDLYEHYLGLEIERRALSETSDTLDKKLKQILHVLSVASEGSSQYSKSLDKFSGSVAEFQSIDELREAVATVLVQTKAMAEQNQLLHTQLEKTTSQLTEVRGNLDKVHLEAKLDSLTQVGNRKFFDEQIRSTLREAHDMETPLTMLMADVDHFKKFNDNYGHLIGDQVLRLVARTLVENLKGRDIIARYGGEEFVILLPNTRLEDAEKVANLLRASLATKQIKRRSTNETLGNITISIGAAEFDMAEDAETFIGRADRAMYKAKQTGRNKVVCDMPDTPQA